MLIYLIVAALIVVTVLSLRATFRSRPGADNDTAMGVSVVTGTVGLIGLTILFVITLIWIGAL
jgi:hypothetical protein